jgi:hypothetical protein
MQQNESQSCILSWKQGNESRERTSVKPRKSRCCKKAKITLNGAA